MAMDWDTMLWTAGLLVASFLTQGSSGAPSDSSANTSGGGAGFEYGSVIAAVAGVVVLVVLIAICVEKRIHVETMDKGPPYWCRSLEFKQEYNGGLSAVSEGMNNLSPFHVIRDRLGSAFTDGARWDCGFTEGKHVFEVVWPALKNRGTNSSLGVASTGVPLMKIGRVSLVGFHSQSWGLDLSSRKMVHSNKRTGSFQKQLADRFFMYVDMDSGKIGFGEDVKALGNQALFYGWIITGIWTDRTTPMHVMVGMNAPREEVQIYYIGSGVAQGGFSLVPPAPVPDSVVVQTSMGGQQQPVPLQQQQQEQQGEAAPEHAVPSAPAAY